MDEWEPKTIRESEQMELVLNDEDCYTLYLHNRGVSVVLDSAELEELKNLLQ